MNKILIATFIAEDQAYQGLDALRELHQKGDITLYSSAVFNKDENGEVEMKQAADEGPIGTALGMLTGSLVGLIGGPAGMALGASTGGLFGLVFDAAATGINYDFFKEISEIVLPGTSVILAEIDEDWVTPVDTKLESLGAIVFRRPRQEVFEEQLAQEAALLDAEMKELNQEIESSNAEVKAAAKKTTDSIKARLESVVAKADAKLDQVNSEAEAKLKSLSAQLKEAKEERKARIEKRIAEVKADQKIRSEKLMKAKNLAKEALRP